MKNAHVAILIQDFQDQLTAVAEGVAVIREQFVTKEEFNALRDDVRTIKMAVRDTTRDVSNHEGRITRLEQAH